MQWYPMRIESGTKSRYSEPNNLLAAVNRLHETAIFQFFHKTVVNQLDDVHFLGFRSARRNFIQNEFGPGRVGVRDFWMTPLPNSSHNAAKTFWSRLRVYFSNALSENSRSVL